MSQPGSEPKREQGQIIVLFVLAIVVIMGFAAFVIDVGVLRNANQNLWNALDAGALAGAPLLPDDPAGASALALQYADMNFPDGLPAGVTVGFRCVVKSVAGAPRASDIPAVCDPGSNAAWICNATICTSICMPYAPELDMCNTIVLESAATVPYNFGPAIGVETGTTQTVISAACARSCGAKPSGPVDLVLLVDRTPSMDATDIENARKAADGVRGVYKPSDQWIALGLIGPSQANDSCQPDTPLGTANLNDPDDLRRWIPVPLSGNGAPLNENYNLSSSALAQTLAKGCFKASSNTVATDLADPFPMAIKVLGSGRTEAIKGIILMTDGQPNNSVSRGGDACSDTSASYDAEAIQAAAAAKSAGIEVFTIGFGLAPGEIHLGCSGPGWPSAGQELRARQLLAAMASPDKDGIPSKDDGCTDAENDDGDHFFCVPKTAGAGPKLAELFKQAANALVGGTKLIQLP